MTVAREGADAVVRVRDNGVGIAPDMLPQHLRPVHPGGRVARAGRTAGWGSAWPWSAPWSRCTTGG